jgi:hypothetical protein
MTTFVLKNGAGGFSDEAAWVRRIAPDQHPNRWLVFACKRSYEAVIDDFGNLVEVPA